MSKCNKCVHMNLFGCKLFDNVQQPVIICAGQELTINGWVNAVNEAEVRGDMYRGSLYRQRVKDLRTQKVKL